MSRSLERRDPRAGVRIALYIVASILALVGIALAVAMQSPVPLLCVVLGLALPLVPVGARRQR